MTRASTARIDKRKRRKPTKLRFARTDSMGRAPPAAVCALLRKEVGFGCPVPECGSPWLEYHHFDPPWKEEHHHRPEGMIALCTEHHPKADGGAYTAAQLRAFKSRAASADREVRSKFDWLRNDLLIRAGGIYYSGFLKILAFRCGLSLWFNRDRQTNHLLLNVQMPTRSGKQRLGIRDHDFLLLGDPEDLKCPPHGKLLSVTYPGGDTLRVEFSEVTSLETLEQYTGREGGLGHWDIHFPVTLCDVRLSVGGRPKIVIGKDRIIIDGKPRVEGSPYITGNHDLTAVFIDY